MFVNSRLTIRYPRAAPGVRASGYGSGSLGVIGPRSFRSPCTTHAQHTDNDNVDVKARASARLSVRCAEVDPIGSTHTQGLRCKAQTATGTNRRDRVVYEVEVLRVLLLDRV